MNEKGCHLDTKEQSKYSNFLKLIAKSGYSSLATEVRIFFVLTYYLDKIKFLQYLYLSELLRMETNIFILKNRICLESRTRKLL